VEGRLPAATGLLIAVTTERAPALISLQQFVAITPTALPKTLQSVVSVEGVGADGVGADGVGADGVGADGVGAGVGDTGVGAGADLQPPATQAFNHADVEPARTTPALSPNCKDSSKASPQSLEQ